MTSNSAPSDTEGRIVKLVKSSKIGAIALVGSLAGSLLAPAFAQEAPIEFRLSAAKTNPSGCKDLDSALSRVHTITLAGDIALVKSAGGINDKLKQSSPKIYSGSLSLGTTTLVVIADASKTPRTLDVMQPSLGCRWNAVAK